MRALRVGFVGFGFIGKVHACGYLNLPLYYRLPVAARITHICTGHAASAEEGCRLVGAEHAVTDYRMVTENPDVDVVHICTPNHRHREALLSAMAHHKHIYCDKPLVGTMAEAEEIRAALPSYRGTAQMTLQNRFFPATMRARQLVESGFLGSLLELRCLYLHAGSVDPKAPLKWKLSAEAGGGVIADLASHAIDLVHFLAGDFSSVMAHTHIAYPDRPAADDSSRRVKVEAEDCVMMLAKMTHGAIGHIEASKLATGSEDDVRFELHGSQGAIRFSGMDPHHLAVYDMRVPDRPVGGVRGWTAVDTGQRFPEPASGFPTPKAAIGWMRGHMACLAEFLQSVADGRPGNPGLDQGLYIQHVMEQCRQSAARRQWVDVAPSTTFSRTSAASGV